MNMYGKLKKVSCPDISGHKFGKNCNLLPSNRHFHQLHPFWIVRSLDDKWNWKVKTTSNPKTCKHDFSFRGDSAVLCWQFFILELKILLTYVMHLIHLFTTTFLGRQRPSHLQKNTTQTTLEAWSGLLTSFCSRRIHMGAPPSTASRAFHVDIFHQVLDEFEISFTISTHLTVLRKKNLQYVTLF